MTSTTKTFQIKRNLEDTKFNSKNHIVYHAVEIDSHCDTILKIQNCLYPSFKAILIKNSKKLAELYDSQFGEWGIA